MISGLFIQIMIVSYPKKQLCHAKMEIFTCFFDFFRLLLPSEWEFFTKIVHTNSVPIVDHARTGSGGKKITQMMVFKAKPLAPRAFKSFAGCLKRCVSHQQLNN